MSRCAIRALYNTILYYPILYYTFYNRNAMLYLLLVLYLYTLIRFYFPCIFIQGPTEYPIGRLT
jgi:hypothetical protein